MANNTVLLIGGWDPQGCAGLTADIKTIAHHDCHSVSLITALTEQSSEGLSTINPVSPDKLLRDFACIQADYEVDAVKIGLIPNIEIAHAIVTVLEALAGVPVVLDPVLSATHGGDGVADEVADFIRHVLIPKVTLVTPNLDELAVLSQSGGEIEEQVEALLAASSTSCLVKGGHALNAPFATDYFHNPQTSFYCYQEKLATNNVRGTGCVLASSIASHLAVGQDIRDAVVLAKAYISRGIRLAEVAGPYHLIHHSRAPLELIDLPKLCYQPDLVGKTFTFPSCPERLGIYPVVDTFDWVKKLVDEGVKTIQLRIKDKDGHALSDEISETVNYLKDKEVAFFVNDHWPLAIEHQAYGVHLGQEDLHDAQLNDIEHAGLRLGISTHSYWELARALAVNPSYIALGPIYETTSKQMPFSPQGEDRLAQWVTLLAEYYPLVAIGGINIERAKVLKNTGVGAVAMITAITQADDYSIATQTLLKLWK
jgi:hydroxymethylpyrimidine kinase/phosphomethylpyrimidine kinase/thiamine-phosphate diphosphorylase